MSKTIAKSTYRHNEVFKASVEYFKGDELAATTWMNKYALKEVNDVTKEEVFYELTPDDMHRRLAKEFARIENKYDNPLSEDEIYSLLKDFKYIIPGGGPMSGIGNDLSIQSLSNCFVVGNSERNQDSYGGILKIDQELVQLCKRRGGVGTDMSGLRPYGTQVTNAAKSSSGVVSFMERYSNSIREVSQHGRRGALMLTISIKHPDAEAFIDAKVDTTKITGANISVKLDEDFMKAVDADKYYCQVFPITEKVEDVVGYMVQDFDEDVIGKLMPGVKKGTWYRIIKARKIWDKLIYNNWKSAEPGVLFWDKVISESPADQYKGYNTTCTNPCGELPLTPYDSCRLIAMNLYSYVKNPFTPDAKFDFDKFKVHVEIAQRLMDDLVDLEIEKVEHIIKKIEKDPEDASIKKVELDLWKNIRQKAKEGRRTGLGITAEGDMLAALGIPYASEEGIEFSSKVHRKLASESYKSSIIMAKERGSFNGCNINQDIKSGFGDRIHEYLTNQHETEILDYWRKYGRRNIGNLTIAPTGTVSLMTQTTSGIEPVFMVSYKRRRKTGDKEKCVFVDPVGDMFEEYRVIHPKFIEWYGIKKSLPYEVANEELAQMDDKTFDSYFKESPYRGSTAQDIDWVGKVKMQGEIQKWVDHSISCTVNMPESTTVKTVDEVYLTAWKSGCKGITIYRDNCRSGVLISDKPKEEPKKPKVVERPEVVDTQVLRFRNGSENWIAFIGIVDNKPFEIFTGKIDDDIKHLPKSIEHGKTVKIPYIEKDDLGEVVRFHRYDFQYEIGFGYVNTLPDIGSAFNPETYNYARMVSAMLQEGMNLNKIINVLSKLKLGETINTWNRGVARALKKFIADGTSSGEKCEKCGGDMVYEGGCKHCSSCGNSKCE